MTTAKPRNPMERILSSPDGEINDTNRKTWGGVLAYLLRKILVDLYDGKGVEGNIQFPDERLTAYQLDELLEASLKNLFSDKLTQSELNIKKNAIIKEMARDKMTMKYFGDLLTVLNPEWVDFTIVIQRKSGITKSYTAHIGGIGTGSYTRPAYNDEYFEQTQSHKEAIEAPPYSRLSGEGKEDE